MSTSPRLLAMLGLVLVSAATAASLELEAKIPLGNVHGRIDHLAIDVNRQRLFVAELGNDSVGVVDLRARKTVRTLTASSNRRVSATRLRQTRSTLPMLAMAQCDFFGARNSHPSDRSSLATMPTMFASMTRLIASMSVMETAPWP